MKIKILKYTKKAFVVEDLTHGGKFTIPEKTLLVLLKLPSNIMCKALEDRVYMLESTAVEV